MDAKRFNRAETVGQWKALVLEQLEDASREQVKWAETFLTVPPAKWALRAPLWAAA